MLSFGDPQRTQDILVVWETKGLILTGGIRE